MDEPFQRVIDAASVPYSAPIGIATLMRRAAGTEELHALATALMARIDAHPDDAHAMMDWSNILQLLGDVQAALLFQDQAIRLQPTYTMPGPGDAAGIRLLAILGPGALMWNTPVELLTDRSDVQLELMFLNSDAQWPLDIPEHDVLLVAVAESEQNRPLLARLDVFLSEWPRPVINLPARIDALSRDHLSRCLQGIPGLVMPLTYRITRAALREAHHAPPALAFPIILRPLDSHAGADLERASLRTDIKDYLGRVGGDDFYLSRYIDYASADGLFRKYRIAMIDGIAYLAHLAISEHWMVHYISAGMQRSAAKRAEEADVMARFADTFARRHAAALGEIHQRLGLRYFQLDCGETRTGELLVFEAGTAMAVHAMDDEKLYPYKRKSMEKLLGAFRRLLDNARFES